ncbi:hypothetical protein [Streptosporangium sp. NPDC049078]|uniref:hypothetical protein n=1 Tax=Streptosporangium sp. NPDC049078 TaxID=3155767 RepID=UPI0034284B11
MPSVTAMSRIRASGARAIAISTRAWRVMNVQVPQLSSVAFTGVRSGSVAAGGGVGADIQNGSDLVPGGAGRPVGGDGGQDGAGLGEQGQGGGGVAGDGPRLPAGLLSGRGEVFGVQVQGKLPGCLCEAFGLVADVTALLAGVVLALVALGKGAPASDARAAESPPAGVGAVLGMPLTNVSAAAKPVLTCDNATYRGPKSSSDRQVRASNS